MKFCPECCNLLYTTEKDDKLHDICKKCGHSSISNDVIITEKVYRTGLFSNLGSKKNMVYDDTYPRTIHKECPNDECISKKDKSMQEAVYVSEKDTLQLVYICTKCFTEWKYS